METAFRPIGSALPPRRDTITAAATLRTIERDDLPMIQPAPQERTLDFFERDQLPSDVRATLSSAWGGDLRMQAMLFNAMLDTWPRLQKNLNEIARRVICSPWKVVPYAKRGENPDPQAEQMAAEIEDIVWRMRSASDRGENGLEATIRNIVFGYYYGHAVSEIHWTQDKDKTWRPRCTKQLPARYYGYPTYEATSDRLMLDASGSGSSYAMQDFPAHRFLVAVNSGHTGHPLVGAPLRALTGYWLASSYGLKWLMSFTQIYGIPWRHAEVADSKDQRSVEAALNSIGANGYIVTKTGTKINVLDAAKGGDQLPQKVLIDLADEQCDKFILGQTLTSGTANQGSRALGEVHADTLDTVVDGLADFVGEVLSRQLIPAIVAHNWGEGREDLPEMWVRREEASDSKAKAERMEILARLNLPMSEAFVYEDLGVPLPADGEKIFHASPDGAQGDPAPGVVVFPHETKGRVNPLPLPVAAAAADQPAKLSDVEQLSSAVLEGLTGVAREWLAPVRPMFDRLAALAMAKNVSDADFLAALEKAQKQLPELFDTLDTETLQTAFEEAIGSAALAGSTQRFKQP